MSQATEQLLKVLFYKIYTTPRRYSSNVNLIFSLKNMLDLDEDHFRTLCEDLDEASLKDALSRVLMNSLETIESELKDRSEKSLETLKNEKDNRDLSSEELLDAAILNLDHGKSLKASDQLKMAIELDENNAELWMYLSDALIISSRYEEAKNTLKNALEKSEWLSIDSSIIESRIESLSMTNADDYYIREIFSSCYHDMAGKLFEKGQFIEAANYYMHILRIIPGDYECMLKLGSCFWRMGDKEAAVKFFHQSLIIMEMPVLVSN